MMIDIIQLASENHCQLIIIWVGEYLWIPLVTDCSEIEICAKNCQQEVGDSIVQSHGGQISGLIFIYDGQYDLYGKMKKNHWI